ncbi:MAG: AAA family ATPase [Planctomycetota bacterium]
MSGNGNSTPAGGASDTAALDDLGKKVQQLQTELHKVIVGQQEVIEQLLICLLCEAHAILEGVPGLAKTLLVRTLADCMGLEFSRIQFTPDLMPADITGTEVLQENKSTGERELRFVRGPIFANMVLADEINRTPPKTQAALLEAMQERQVSVAGEEHALPSPFFVLATQNPIEQEGTYPLPEAQQDRFMFKIFVGYPGYADEFQVIRQTTIGAKPKVQQVLSGFEVLALRDLVRQVPVSDHVIHHALTLVRQTRIKDEDVPDFARHALSWGAGPRAGQYLIMGAKARAVLRGRPSPETSDVDAVARPVLRHRLMLTYAAQGEGMTVDHLVDRLVAATPKRAAAYAQDQELRKILQR